MDPSPGRQQIARLTLAAEARWLPAALALVREAAATAGLSSADGAGGLERAVAAVARNVVERGFEPGHRGVLDVVVLREPGRLVVAVEDQGLPFDWQDLDAAQGSTVGAASLAAGLDAVRFESLGNRGNRVEIAARLPFAHVETYLDPEERKPAPPGTAAPADTPVSIRLMAAEDAVAVARCTYRCYGYSVPDEYLYFPDHLREMLAGGSLEVCVGATPDGEIASLLTLELERPGAAVGRLGEAMVDPRFRGHGLFEQMKRFMKTRAQGRGLLGIASESVTVHPFSQKGNIALGASETGIQLGDEAPTVVFTGIAAGAPRQRTATVLYYLETNPAPARVVHAPPQHREIIGRIYEHGRFRRTLPSPGAAAPGPPAEAARVQVEVYPEWSEASLHVTACGPDLPDLVRARLRELCLRRIDWIGLDLPLGDPGTRALCAPLEALGFFFAGILPEAGEAGDVLRLQYLNNVDADVASAQIASDFGRALFAYVVQARDGRPR